MNKFTAFISDALVTVLVIVAIGTALAHFILGWLPAGTNPLEALQGIICTELVLAAFFWLLGRGFMKRHKDFVNSEDTGLTVEREEEE